MFRIETGMQLADKFPSLEDLKQGRGERASRALGGVTGYHLSLKAGKVNVASSLSVTEKAVLLAIWGPSTQMARLRYRDWPWETL